MLLVGVAQGVEPGLRTGLRSRRRAVLVAEHHPPQVCGWRVGSNGTLQPCYRQEYLSCGRDHIPARAIREGWQATKRVGAREFTQATHHERKPTTMVLLTCFRVSAGAQGAVSLKPVVQPRLARGGESITAYLGRAGDLNSVRGEEAAPGAAIEV